MSLRLTALALTRSLLVSRLAWHRCLIVSTALTACQAQYLIYRALLCGILQANGNWHESVPKENFVRVFKNSSILFIVVLALLLSACGGTASPSSSAPTSTPKPAVKHSGQTAAQIVAALKGKGLPITDNFTYDENTDLNKLLGRPNQYTGKVNFRDSRTSYSDAKGADINVSDGGSVEVFANASDAAKRYAYVQAISSSGGLFAEYDYYDNGLALLRVSHELTPNQAKEYEGAFTALP